MNDLFVIAAGGTGAKVVEALTHLCAAGLAPGKVHVLLIDGDVSNGNRLRTLRTWESYKRVQSWPWRVSPNSGEGEKISVFSTDLEIYSLAERFSLAERGGLRALVSDDPELGEALGVLFDDEELDMEMGAGFMGRPNLACLVMSHYLDKHLSEHDRAKAFIQALKDSACKSDGSNPRIAVVGSVFGGTGASLFSIAKQCVRVVFEKPDPSGQTRTHLYAQIRWGKVMLLPYFRPRDGLNLGIVNPSRHVVDTSGALWYYGLTQPDPEPVYVIGSDTPSRNIVVARAGIGQNNPPFYHELLAALALLDFHAAPKVEGNRPIRHFSGAALTAPDQESCALANLPAPTGLSQELVRSRLALLLHLASFSVDWRESPACPEFFKGLFQYAKESQLTGWDKSVHEPLVSDRHSLQVRGDFCWQAIEYFARLLLWGQSVFASEESKSTSLDYDPEPGRYASLHNTMCLVRRDEFEVTVSGPSGVERDNLAAKICRLALVGLVREDASRGERDYRGHGLTLNRNSLLTHANTVRLGMAPHSLANALVRHHFDVAQIESWFAEFQLPMPKR